MNVKPSLEELISVSVAVYEKNKGYFRKNSHNVVRGDKKANAAMIYEHFLTPVKKRTIVITEEHNKQAREIISNFTFLFLKALKGKVTNFESKVMKLMKCTDAVEDSKLIGLSGCLPLINTNKVAYNRWVKKIQDIAEDTNVIGVVGEPISLSNVTVEFIKLTTSDLDSVYVAGTTKDNDIVEFRSSFRHGWGTRIKINDMINIKGIVSEHEKNTENNNITTILTDVLVF